MAHLHEVLDDDPHFKIDDESRKITLTSEKDPILIQNDHNSERFTFEIPKLIDGHDMELCDEVRVHFINIDAENPDVTVLGLYKVDDFRVSTEDPSTMLFSWLIAREATTLVGTVSFVVEFICKNGDNIIDYSWHTDIYSGVIVAKSIDNTEVIIGQYYDVLNQWITLIYQAGDDVRTDVLDRIDSVASQAETRSKEQIKAYAEKVKRDLTVYGLDVSGVLVQETGDNPDKIISQEVVTKELNVLDAKLGTHKTDVTAEINRFKTEITKAINEANAYEEIPLSLSSVADNGVAYNGAEIEFGKTYLIEDKVKPTFWTFILQIYVEYSRVSNHPENTATYPNGMIVENIAYEFKYSPAREGYGVFRLLTMSGTTEPGVSIVNGTMHMGAVFDDELYVINRTYDENPGDYVDTIISVTTRVWGYPNKLRLFKYRPYPALQQTGFLVNANGISGITKTKTEGLTHTYTITLDNGEQTTFEVKDGVGISNFALSERGDYEDTYRIDLTDGTNKTFKVPNNNAVGIVTSDSGPSIHTMDLSHLEHTVKAKVRSKNLIPHPYPYNYGFINGVEFTPNEDGSITAVGTVNDGTFANVMVWKTFKPEIGKTYYIGNSPNLLLACKDETGTTIYLKNQVFTWREGYEFIQIYLQYSPNVVVNETVYPMLCESDTAVDFLPYVNPSDVTLRRCGKNLIPPPTVEAGKTKYGVTLTDDGDGTITLNGTATSDTAFILYEGSTLLKGTYTLSGFTGGSGTTAYIQPYIDGKGKPGLINGSYTYSDIDGVLTKIQLSIVSGAEFDNVKISLMLEAGDTATEFEEYVGEEYGIASDGVPILRVTSLAPTMNLLTNKMGTIIDATYNVDQTAAYNKINKLLETLLNGGA